MIIVAGVDGSGTSGTVKVFRELGLEFPGPLINPHSVESRAARRINDKIMSDLTGKIWGEFPDYDELTAYDTSVAEESEDINWKDPRVNITLPVWRDWNPKIIWVKRSPINVVNSWMQRRGHYPRPEYEHPQQILKFIVESEGYLYRTLVKYDIPYHVVCYENWYKEKDVASVKHALGFCGHGAETEKIITALEGMKIPINE